LRIPQPATVSCLEGNGSEKVPQDRRYYHCVIGRGDHDCGLLMLNEARKLPWKPLALKMTGPASGSTAYRFRPSGEQRQSEWSGRRNPEGFKAPRRSAKRRQCRARDLDAPLGPVGDHTIHIDGAELDYESGSGGSTLSASLRTSRSLRQEQQASSRKIIIKTAHTNTKLRVACVLLGQAVPVPPGYSSASIGRRRMAKLYAR